MPAPSAVHTLVFDFDGVFTNNKVWLDQNGVESVRCDRADGLALDMLRAYQRVNSLRLEAFILSKEHNPVVTARAAKLKLACNHAVGDKLQFLNDHVGGRFPASVAPLDGLIYLGNDLNDLGVMRRAGFSVAPSDAHERVKEIADLVMPQRGGEGFVRAFVERWLGINELSLEEIDEFVSHC